MFFVVVFTYIASDEINFDEILENLLKNQVFINKTLKSRWFRAPGGLGPMSPWPLGRPLEPLALGPPPLRYFLKSTSF